MLMSTECPKCSGVLEEGFVIEPDEGNTSYSVWVEGKPSDGVPDDIRGSGKRIYRIQAYRCMSCGYTELYSEMSL